MNHALVCKRGGFISSRHDNIRDTLTVLLSKVCNNFQAEPHLTPLDNEVFTLRTANTSEEARLDIKANSFWRRGQTAFFDVRITHVNSASNINKETATIFKQHEMEKKRQYLQRVLDVEHGSFTPLIMGTNGGMGKECDRFIKNLSDKLATKNNDGYSSVVSWVRTRLSFEILKSVILCVRGSKSPFYKPVITENDAIDDFHMNASLAGILS